jgi:hypothetical protein
MKEFEIGDIVKKRDGRHTFLYMVTDFSDFSVMKGSKEVIDIDYEITQIYPVTMLTQQSIESPKDLILHARNKKDKDFILEFVTKERETRGMFGKPDFIRLSEQNLKAHEKEEMTKAENGRIVRYDLLEDIDQCLDAMNDLEELHNVFKDEEYLKHRDLVKEKLKELV